MISNTVMFDLDGTLLPMDQDVFTGVYFGYLAEAVAPLGYAREELIQAVWKGVRAMVANDGTRTNEEAFWDCFASLFERDVRQDIPRFDQFYREEFVKARKAAGYDPGAAETVAMLKDAGCRLILATNPIFPAVATEQRIRWAGLDPDDFDYMTTYENSHYSKPNPLYYTELLNKCGISPREAVMIGNDTVEDLAALRAGMRVFILTDCLINTRKIALEDYPHGSWPELMKWLKQEEGNEGL